MLGRDSASRASDQVRGVEPQMQRRGRPVEEGPRGWVDVVPTAGAGPRLATLLRRVLLERHAFALALRAVGMLAVRRVARAPKVLKAGCIVGELPHELHERVVRVRALGALR